MNNVQKEKRKPYLLALAIIAGLILLDQATKWLIVQTMDLGQSEAVIPSLLYITSHRNTGAAWGMFAGQMVFFTIITILALALFVFIGKDIDFKEKRFFSYAIVLLIAGTLGNFIDRVSLGYVIDFIDVYIFTYDFPIFNVADMCLTIGMIFLGIDILLLEPKRKEAYDANKDIYD
ncbi:MAG: signal peptidase II [Bacillota bacterium]